jgi:hypothetical protein
MYQTENIKVLLEGFVKINSRFERERLISDKKDFAKILNWWRSVCSLNDSYETKNASEYNIFYILKNITNKEVITHTPFLKDLLNINGTHKQGNLFFNEFLKQLNLTERENAFTPTDYNLLEIIEPFYIGNIDRDKLTGGSIDLLIKYSDGIKNFAIAIENKIWAVDQEKQLERYNNYLKNRYKNYLLVYLTPKGSKPTIENALEPESKYSITQKTYDYLKSNKILLNLSYHEHISQLFEKVMPFIKAKRVKFTIEQYLTIITNEI